ncbi:hemerythrin domain-containing protein [Alkalibaculum sp. M08DMB]|uniref:Hemerythrin domain-containing protein n=1 Tax=Alkalibaculum sporogenes TaxID=2655001 RepID=A0A6A7KBU3_9FIRM|nr:hemerythrin domain-containing protein [Alkalibaculum sporogenes]MPW26822.1 hemerythrin domain-containing protein [Alkalibaculum sporogenes]
MNNSIELMVDEHKYIKRMLVVVRKNCFKVLKGEDVDYNDFFLMIDFVRNYADKHHHGKEEELLFNRMMNEQGPTAEKLVRHGMLVEHDLGRLNMQELEIALKNVMEGDEEAKLDVIANAISYTHLLYRHIDKEDNVVYKYAENGLSSDTLEEINRQCIDFEEEARKNNVQEKYITLLEDLEAKLL